MAKPAKLKFTIYQGATFSKRWDRLLCAYAVENRNGVLVNAITGAPVPDADLIPDDYTGCTARMQLRDEVLSSSVLLEMTTANGGITLGNGWVQLDQSDEQTTAMLYGDDAANGKWSRAIGQLEIERTNGTVERQYEITFVLSPEGTR